MSKSRIVDRYGKPIQRDSAGRELAFSLAMLAVLLGAIGYKAHNILSGDEPVVTVTLTSYEPVDPALDEAELRERLEAYCSTQSDTWLYDSTYWREAYEDCYERYGQVPPGDSL